MRNDHGAVTRKTSMRIICPTCASHYEVDETRIAAQGQLVRCARCRDVWLVRSQPTHAGTSTGSSQTVAASPDQIKPAGESPAPDMVGIVAPEVIDFNAAKVRLRPRGKPASTGREWAMSLTVFAVGAIILSSVTSLYTFRRTIADRIPVAAALYETIGLPVANDKLALRDVRSVLVAEGGETVLTLQGQIANTSDRPAAVPNLTVVVRGESKLPLYTWTAAAPKSVLARGEAIDFRSRLASPPSAGRDVRVSFAEPPKPGAALLTP